MESVKYRNEDILIKTIPKGTLLFRLTKAPKNDLRGIPRADGNRCILSNHNVFFYPNPFVGKMALSQFVKSKDLPTITVFILKNDVKVFWLVEPSKYTRVDKNKKRFFIKRCSTIRKGCVDKKIIQGLHAPYNPCLSDTIIKKYPDIVGMLTIAFGDANRIEVGTKNSTVRVRKFLHTAKDSSGVSSIPEIILHPLKQRPQKDLIVTPGETLETNYKILTTLDSSNESSLEKFMNKHAVYNPNTFFFSYKI